VVDDRRIGCSFAGPVALVVLTGALTGIGSAGTSRPDLVETSVVVSQSTVQGGGRLRVTDVVVDRGQGTAPRTVKGFYLSRHRKHGRDDLRLGRRAVGRLSSGARSRRTTGLPVPLAAAGHSYRVFACADDRRWVRETRETNNCRAAARAIRVTAPGDHAPPTFAGLESATTCIPGPIGPSRTAPYHLAWSSAADDVSPASAIVYDVYQATRSGGEDFSAATYTTAPGVTTFTTPPLSSTETYYFVVRARDEAGNRDSNKVERMGINPCV
jgi:CARDB